MCGEYKVLAERQTRVTDYNWGMRLVVSVEYFYYYFILNDIFSAFFSRETFNYFFSLWSLFQGGNERGKRKRGRKFLITFFFNKWKLFSCFRHELCFALKLSS